ncbi:hypothetical protein LOTGIDRAFT_176280 [Lottia gigantea]|uniref:Uncharacterized protein n=1 Tax=Lottia gigantea TaxID=225164 RepID=V3ZNR8_LOTGI|nr:hypothetical protein LOTGIDRAFT_176280 [Lottia gigantea]ESO82511.1 hypothetical protein LOTGIDRAFT_176280 [Lottia gigantea]
MEGAKFKILSYDEQRRVALIEFEEREVVFRLLRKKEIEFHGQTITILPHKLTVADCNNPRKHLKVTGFNSRTSTEMKEMYFESKKKSGGEAESVNFVSYETIEDAEIVCRKQHTIGNDTVYASKYVPPPKWNHRFLISNISEDTSLIKLKNFLEGKLGCDTTKILFNEVGDKAIVYCSSDQYVIEKDILLDL